MRVLAALLINADALLQRIQPSAATSRRLP